MKFLIRSFLKFLWSFCQNFWSEIISTAVVVIFVGIMVLVFYQIGKPEPQKVKQPTYGSVREANRRSDVNTFMPPEKKDLDTDSSEDQTMDSGGFDSSILVDTESFNSITIPDPDLIDWEDEHNLP
jgi:predicted membrane protein